MLDPQPATAFVGRERELEQLLALAEAAAGGDGQVAVIAGDAGIGKSRLAAELLAACQARGFGCLAAEADEVQQRRPFGVIREALGVDSPAPGLRQEIAELLEGHAGGENGRDDGERAAGKLGLESRIADMLALVVGDACRDSPLVLVLDDLQWADESSLVAIAGVARQAGSRPLLLVCALRRSPASAPLRALLASLAHLGAQRFELAGLPGREVARLATSRIGAPAGPRLRDALKATAGNPFYVDQLLSCLLRDSASLARLDGVVELTAPGLPASLRHAVLEQLRFLPEVTLEVLRAASLVGRSFSLAEVALVSPSAVTDVAAALSPALETGVAVTDGERLAFGHDLIRETIHEQMPPAVSRGLHRHLAAQLDAAGAGVERVAAQVMLGAEPGDAEAVGWLRRAAGEALASGPAIAADLLTRALELADEAFPERGELLAEAVRPLLWSGRAADAERVCSEGLAGAPGDEDEPLFRLGLADARLLQGRFQDARATCDEGLEGATLEEADRLHLEVVGALCGILLGDPQGIELARTIVATAPPSVPRVTAQDAIGQWELFTGHADRALAAFEAADVMRAQPGMLVSRIWHGSEVRVRMWHALALLDLDRLKEAAALLEAETAAKITVPALPHALLAACHYHAGHFDHALAESGAAGAAADANGSFTPASAPALAAMVALRRGDPERAQKLLVEAEHVRIPAEIAGDTIVRWVRALQLEATGRAQEAAEAAAGALAAYQRAGFASYMAWHAPDLVRIALTAGQADQAERAVLAAEHAATMLPVPSRRAGALRARGLLNDDTALLLDAVTAARQAPRPLDLAHTLRDAAAALVRDGQRDRARPLAGEALALLAQLGATGDERATRQLLRQAGLRIGARGKHTSAGHGWEGLTQAELRVAALAADGRPNAEIAQALHVSPRTVGWHLANIYRKLGLSTRAQLAADAARRESH
jgi:DNA-binding CsgD family transcriptional regulator